MPNSYGTPVSAQNLVEGRTYIFKSNQPGEGAFVFQGTLDSKTPITAKFTNVRKMDGTVVNPMKIVIFTFDFFTPPVANIPGPGMGGSRRASRMRRKTRKSRSRKTRRRV